MANIHPTALVDPAATIGPGVEIGPSCRVEGPVVLEEGVRLIGNVYITGPATIGRGTTIYPFACLGFPGQDFKFTPGMPTAGVRIGAECILREGVTVHAATKTDRPTTVGDKVMMMAQSHVGHDGQIASHAILINGAVVAGHATVGERAILSGLVAVHQFCRVGRLAMISGGSVTSVDVPPFCVVWGRNSLAGINMVGMRRAGIPRPHITLVRQAYREVLRLPMLRADAVGRLAQLGADCPPVMELCEFYKSAKRAIAVGAGRRHHGADSHGSDTHPEEAE